NVEAVNGVIHILDNVLLPPSILDRARLDGRFTTLITALERTGLDAAVSGTGSFTVFAPTDDAFSDANIDLDNISDEDLENLLLYHVLGAAVPAGDIAAGDNFVMTLDSTGPGNSLLSALVNKTGDAVTLNGDVNVVVPDVFATNGVVHAIDKVLSRQSIVDFAVKAEGTSELETALIAADLVGALSDDGPFTVFAPVNTAFDAAADTIATFMGDQLSQVLTYHVANGNVRSTDLSSTDVPTLNTNDNIEIRLDPGDDSTTPDDDFFFIRTSDSTSVNFILTDIQGTNGVIHLIDSVLLPEGL
ncbi:MAG: fasciclin domain-containing protein, partial [Bacteroidota bacterium]